MRTRKWWVLAAIAWMIAIFFFTQLPYFTGHNTGKVIHKVVVTEQQSVSATNAAPIDTNELNLLVRKTTHVIVFGILAFLLLKSLEALRFSYVLAWCLTVIYAITDEWHQSFMPRRVAAYQDVLFDSFGAFVVLLISYFIIKRKKVKSRD
ncbi:VanZ family protein [Neobacillus sp. 3P2-tot-E-2]|uniref:VanZ family protein n=1 Tax=Neobacillus sp. 3P2-tot-E-2 TaxID=3132212 RepID=UPI0039A37C00